MKIRPEDRILHLYFQNFPGEAPRTPPPAGGGKPPPAPTPLVALRLGQQPSATGLLTFGQG